MKHFHDSHKIDCSIRVSQSFANFSCRNFRMMFAYFTMKTKQLMVLAFIKCYVMNVLLEEIGLVILARITFMIKIKNFKGIEHIGIEGIHYTATKSKETRNKILALASTKYSGN